MLSDLNDFIILDDDIWSFFLNYKCCLRASVDTEMCCPKGKCGCQYFIVSFAKVTRYRSFCLIFFGEDIYIGMSCYPMQLIY